MAQTKTELLAVMQLLKKYNLKVRMGCCTRGSSRVTFCLRFCSQILKFSHTFLKFSKGTEELLRREANLTESASDPVPADSDVSSVLAAYKSEGDPEIYEQSYMELRRFVDESLDIYKVRYLLVILIELLFTNYVLP